MRIPDHWISKAEVAARLQVHAKSVPSIALAGGIRTRELPGVPIRYHADDVAALAQSAEHKTQRPPAAGVAV